MERYRLQWRRTWPDKALDYAASDPVTGEQVGRIHFTTQATPGFWLWVVNGVNHQAGVQVDLNDRAYSGRADSKQEAADALTEAWHHFKAKVAAASQSSAYAKAKGL